MIENEKATILLDLPIITDRHVPCNKPDIVMQEKSDRSQIMDVAIPSNHNIQKKATEKMSKYVDLQMECQRLWNKKVEVILVNIGATGIVDKNIKKYAGRYQAAITSTACRDEQFYKLHISLGRYCQ